MLIGKTKTAEMVGASAVLWGLAGQRNESLQRVAEDLIVCHVTNGQARIYYLNQSSFGSGAFFFKETMYYGWGSSVPGEPVLWRWSGTNFTRLAKSKADAIRSQFRYTSDLMAEEGWQEIPCVSFRSYAGTGDKAPLEVSGRRLWLVVKQEGGFSGKSTVLIRGLAGSNSEQPIITLDQSMKRIDQATYNRLRLIATKTRIPGAR